MPVTDPGPGRAADEEVPAKRARPRRWLRLTLLAVVYLVGCWFLYWTVTSSGNPISLGGPQNDYYNQLADGFLKGHLYLLTEPPKALTSLSDPYSFAQNAPYQPGFHDLSLYHGHFYLSWGPTPALALFIPWRLLQQGAIPQSLAIALFSFGGLAGLLGTFELLARRFVPRLATWRFVLCAVALTASSVVPYLLRRPDVYEVAISAGFCFAALGLWCAAKVVADGRFRSWYLWAASFLFGLAAGARWDLIVLGALLGALAIWRIRSEQRSGVWNWVRSSSFIAPWVVVVVGLLWYNWARFDNPLQFGSYYQLAGFDPQTTPYYQLGYLAPSLYYYLVAPVRITFAFPYFALPPPPAYPGSVPAAYSPEIIGGIFTTTPICLWLLAALPLLRRRVDRSLFVAMCAVLGCAALVVFAIAFGIPGGTMRYEVDFASLLVLPAVICWLALVPARRWLRRLSTVLGAIALVYGAVVGVAISFTGPNDQMQSGNPGSYQRLEDLTSPVPTLLTMVLGHPDLVRVMNSLVGYPGNLGDYGTYQPSTETFTANINGTFQPGGGSYTAYVPPDEIDVISPSAGHLIVRGAFTRTSNAPHRGRITVVVKAQDVTTEFAFRAGHHEVTVPVKRGLNRIYLWASTSRALPKGTWPDILNVNDLTVAAAPHR